MVHTLLEQQWNVDDFLTFPAYFLEQKFGLVTESTGNYRLYPLNGSGGVGLYGLRLDKSLSGSSLPIIVIKDKNGTSHGGVTGSPASQSGWKGSIFYHVSSGETVKYFKYVLDDELKENSFTCILAEDTNGDWVIINGDKMYSNYGAIGIYNNFYDGTHSGIVDSDNQFIISKACRLDTGAEFKELYFVLSARSYTDTNCIVDFKGKTYRLVSVSNVKDETGRYPAFAFPVSD